MRRALVPVIVLVAGLAAGESHATVYTWLDDGVRHFTNSSDEVPEAHRHTVKAFPTTSAPLAGDATHATPPLAGDVTHAAREEPAAPDQASAVATAYGRGVEHGARIALAQTRAVGELARSLVETALLGRAAPPPPPPPPPTRPMVERTSRRAKERPEFRVSIVPSGDRFPGGVLYGYAGPVAGCPGCCCASGLGYGFGFGRLVPHSHFFPSLAGARRTPLFFPYGHQLDANSFLVGRAFWVD